MAKVKEPVIYCKCKKADQQPIYMTEKEKTMCMNCWREIKK